jgi:hypothetical protein
MTFSEIQGLGPTIKWQKSCPHCRKKPKIDLWDISGCAKIQEIERPDPNVNQTSLTSGVIRLCRLWSRPWM